MQFHEMVKLSLIVGVVLGVGLLDRDATAGRLMTGSPRIKTLRSSHLATIERASPPKPRRNQDALRQAPGAAPTRRPCRTLAAGCHDNGQGALLPQKLLIR